MHVTVFSYRGAEMAWCYCASHTVHRQLQFNGFAHPYSLNIVIYALHQMDPAENMPRALGPSTS